MNSKDLFSFLGQTVQDRYNREIGKIVSFVVSPRGQIDKVLINHMDGEFSSYPTRQLNIENNSVVLLSDLKSRASDLCKEVPLVWRKDQVLNNLLKDDKILPEIYETLHQEFDDALNKLKVNAQDVLDEIDHEISRCDERFKNLHSAKTYLEIESVIGKIDRKSYIDSKEIILDGLKSIITEKNDFEGMKTRLSNLLLGEEPMIEETVEELTPDTEGTLISEEPIMEETVEEKTDSQEPTIIVHLK